MSNPRIGGRTQVFRDAVRSHVEANPGERGVVFVSEASVADWRAFLDGIGATNWEIRTPADIAKGHLSGKGVKWTEDICQHLGPQADITEVHWNDGAIAGITLAATCDAESINIEVPA